MAAVFGFTDAARDRQFGKVNREVRGAFAAARLAPS